MRSARVSSPIPAGSDTVAERADPAHRRRLSGWVATLVIPCAARGVGVLHDVVSQGLHFGPPVSRYLWKRAVGAGRAGFLKMIVQPWG